MPNAIKQIIDEWDPIGLSAISPKDEYIFEIEQIETYVKDNAVIVDQLAQEIDGVFLRAFGDGVYRSDMEQCLNIAKKIIKALSQQ